MKKLLFTILFLFVFTANCKAEWTFVATGKSGGSVSIDFEKIKKSDGKIYFWYLIDFNEAKNYEFGTTLSNAVYAEADCKIYRFNDIEYHAYSQKNGKGTLLNSFKNLEKDWYNPLPNTLYDIMLTRLCTSKF